nr:hypothetical protein BaRGS_004957 [Batillaria attramentaria]
MEKELQKLVKKGKGDELKSYLKGQSLGNVLMLMMEKALRSCSSGVPPRSWVESTEGSKAGAIFIMHDDEDEDDESQDAIVQGDSSMKGSEFKGHVLNSLCSCKWSPQMVIHLAAMFSDMTLTSDELRFVLEKIMRQFDDLDLRDLPSLVYQLLLLSEKGHKRLILEGITSFFITKDTLARSQGNVMDSEDLMEDTVNTDLLRQTEGTVILHVSFAVMEQRELGQEFLKYLKAWQYSCASKVLSPFNMALALSIAGMNVLNEQILEFLKSTVLRSFKDRQRHQLSYWVRENFPEQTDIGDLVLETVRNCSSSWEHVVHGLVQLGFLLMDSFGPRLVFGRPETVITGQLTPNQAACQLGSKIILKVFKGHEIVRSDILGQVFNRVMTETSAPASHYLNLLSEMVVSAPLLLLESVGKVREVFDCLPLLPPDTAKGLLVALLPLLKISMSLKDTLILLLRKSIFSRQLDERKIGVQGFLSILRSFRVPVDIHTQYNRSSNEALCLEILGILQRCLSQQADIRLSLYQGLVDVLSRNTQLKARIMDMLRKQAHLMSCIQQCVQRVKQIVSQTSDDDDDEVEDDDDAGEGCSGSGLADLENMLDKLTTRMIQTDMEDFELDKAADFSTANSVGVRNNIFAILLLGTYEVLMEHNFTAGNFRLFLVHYTENQLAEEGRERSPDEDQRHLKDVGSLMSIISQLTTHLTPGGSQYEQVLTWTRKLCVDENLDDVATSKLLLGCLLKLSTQMKSFPQLLRDIMQDLHSQLGDIDREVEVEDRTHFAVITQRTAAPHIVTLLLPYVDHDLDDTDWIISRMKADTNPQVLSEDSAMGPTQQEGFEKLTCTRLAVLVAGFHELVQSAVPPGPTSAAMFKTLTKFYSSLLTIIKYYLHLYQQRAGHMSSRFEKLVKLIGTQLTPYVYNFITYVQTMESEQLDQAEPKKGGKSRQDTKSQKGGKTKTMVKGGKQDKLIPNLIFAIEDVERHLVKLSKKAKVNLMENIKMSTSRDFRINAAIVQDALQVSSDEEEDEGTAENMDDDNDDANGDDEQVSEKGSDEENMNPDPPAQVAPDKSKEPATKKRKLGKSKQTR